MIIFYIISVQSMEQANSERNSPRHSISWYRTTILGINKPQPSRHNSSSCGSVTAVHLQSILEARKLVRETGIQETWEYDRIERSCIIITVWYHNSMVSQCGITMIAVGVQVLHPSGCGNMSNKQALLRKRYKRSFDKPILNSSLDRRTVYMVALLRSHFQKFQKQKSKKY